MAADTYFFLKFRESRSNPKRYLMEVICGYSVPLLFLIMTGIAESSLDQCSKYRPRFNEQSCFFSGIYNFKHWSKAFRILDAIVNIFFSLDIESKSVWFFLPIGIALLINSVIFALTCKAVCALDAQARDLGITSGQRSKKMERYVICAKIMLTNYYSWHSIIRYMLHFFAGS